jgi:RNA polymerase sigma factor (sigma-70 family)
VFNKVNVIVIYTIMSENVEGDRTLTSRNNEDLARAVNSFARLYDDHLTSVFRYVQYRLGDRTEAADVTATVFEKALAAFHNYRSEKSAPQTWLIAIARNTVTDHLRRSKRRSEVPLDNAANMVSTGMSPEEFAENNEEREVLRACYSVLPQRDQDIVSLKFGAEITNRRIATVTGLSENNVGAILFRAIHKLRQCFQEWLNGKR